MLRSNRAEERLTSYKTADISTSSFKRMLYRQSFYYFEIDTITTPASNTCSYVSQ
ncbi:predicted protein [Botrytis cinerea T4]|uniref:Uncharacterized protein n=1 Tax=Botryotinia fuckeliana (strain T4) TaxID=999810 RepID=G2XXU5_BOTF4|nr:predicted protein [Botrytis cinerea T4]